jgi:hypothetical protein
MNKTEQIIKAIVENANNGTTAFACEAHTDAPMNKTIGGRGTPPNPFYGKVTKVAHIGGLVGINYQNCVNNQLGREGKETDFVAKERKWGVHDKEHGFIIRHTPKGSNVEKSYLEIKVQQSNRLPRYFDKASGEEIAYETIKPFLKASNAPSTQDALEKKVILRTYWIETMKEISIGGKRFSFKDADPLVTFKASAKVAVTA